VGRIANDAQLEIPKNQLLMQFIASLQLSCRSVVVGRSGMGFAPSWKWRRLPVPAVPCEASGPSSSAGPQSCGEGIHWGRGHAVRRRCESLP
jgi:hypothetical protein